jgi:glycosyltransferase involved in cell wall biosynthesis
LPSHAYETLGKTILESYAEGRAVVASDTGSRRELVHEGKTGLLFPVGDAHALGAALKTLASQPGLADRMGRAGRDLVREHHTAEGHYKRLLNIYTALIARKPRQKNELVQTTKAAPWETSARPGSTAPAIKVPDLPARNLRIAFVGGRGVISKYSGIESYYEEVGTRLAEMGHEVTIYCRNYFTPALTEHNKMRLVRLPTIRSKHLETVIHTLLSTAHAMTQKYDVVHYHALGPALFSSLPRLTGSRTAVTVQGLDWQRKKWGRIASAALRLGERASAKLPNATMVVSKTLRRRFREVHGVEAVYVPNGGLLRERREPHKILEWGLEPRRYVLFLGRFSPEKGCHLLVEAFEQLDTGVKLVMAGASSYCDDYGRKLRQHAGERILMLDWVAGDVLDELLTNAMIFVLPSDLEGLSLALLDAMGAGLCVVTSDIPENREVVDGAGFTFQPGNATDLAERLRFLIANPSVREAAGKAARERVRQDYQWPRIATEIEAAYFDMMGLTQLTKAPKKFSASAGVSSGPGRRVG